jgi:4'-phosphopantetheinyl transferase EntD
MNQIKLAGVFSSDVARELDEIRAAAAAADTELRTLQDLEMGWVAGGDGAPVWPG